MTATLSPTTEMVLRSWLRDVCQFPQAGAVLPTDVSKWSDTGFVQYTVVGGTPDLDTPTRRPLVQLDFWALNPNSSKAPVNRAAAMAEQLAAIIWDPRTYEVGLDLGGSYGPARLSAAYMVTEPRPLRDQLNDAARITVDLQIVWIAV